MVNGSAYQYRTGIPWRDLSREQLGPWQMVWRRHRRYAADGTWDRGPAHVLAEADAAGMIDWDISADATMVKNTDPTEHLNEQTTAVVFTANDHGRYGFFPAV